MYKEVSEYRQFVNNLPEKIKKSTFKISGIIAKSGISKASFYKKMKNNTFSLEEVERISRLLYIEEEIQKELERAKKDVEKGRVVPVEDFFAELYKKFNFK